MQDIKRGNCREGREQVRTLYSLLNFSIKPKLPLKFFFLFFMATALGGVRGLAFLGLSHSLTM